MNIATTLRLPEKELKALRMIATMEGKTMSKIIHELVEEYLEDYFDVREAKEALKEKGEIPWEEVKKQWGIED